MSDYMRGPRTLRARLGDNEGRVAPTRVLELVRAWLQDVLDTRQCEEVQELIESLDAGDV